MILSQYRLVCNKANIGYQKLLCIKKWVIKTTFNNFIDILWWLIPIPNRSVPPKSRHSSTTGWENNTRISPKKILTITIFVANFVGYFTRSHFMFYWSTANYLLSINVSTSSSICFLLLNTNAKMSFFSQSLWKSFFGNGGHLKFFAWYHVEFRCDSTILDTI